MLTVTFPEGSGPKEMAARLKMHAALLLGKSAKEAASRDNTDGEDEEEKDVITPSKMVKKTAKKKTAKKKAKPIEEDEDNEHDDNEPEEKESEDEEGEETDDEDSDETGDEESEETESEEDTESDESEDEGDEKAEEDEPKPKKAAKVTIKMVNDACKSLAANKKYGRKGVEKILKTKFKAESLQEIDSKLWPAVIKAMKV
jgi:hypothetical protein